MPYAYNTFVTRLRKRYRANTLLKLCLGKAPLSSLLTRKAETHSVRSIFKSLSRSPGASTKAAWKKISQRELKLKSKPIFTSLHISFKYLL